MTAGLPLTRAQQHIWIAEQLDDTGRRLIVGGYVHMRGAIDEEIFERALRIVVAGAETLRVRFDTGVDGSVTQVVEEVRDWPLHRNSFRTAADPRGAALRFMEAALDRPFDLGRAPLLEHHLLDLGAAGAVWFIRSHHLVIDGASSAAFIRRVADTYTALLDGRPVVESVFDRVADLIAEDERFRTSARFADDRQFWARRLATDGPYDAPQFAGAPVAADGDRFLRRAGVLAAAEWQALRARAETSGTPWPVWAFAAIAILLHADSGTRTVTLGLAVPAKRSRNALGMTANVLPLRITVDPATTVGDLLAAVRAESLVILRHQRFQYGEMLADLRASGLDGGIIGPTVNVMPMQKDLRFGSVSAGLRHIAAGRADNLNISLYDNGDPALSVVLESNTLRYSERDLTAHHRRLTETLAALAAAPEDLPLGRLRCAPDPAGPSATAPSTETLVDRFGRMVVAHGDATAVVHGDAELTYAELDRQAKRLSRIIAGYGVGPGDFVGLALPRSLDLVVAIVAVSQTGAAYVPLDPGYPEQRLRTIIDDAAPALIVTGAEVQLPETSSEVYRLRIGDAPQVVPREPRHPGPSYPAYVIHTSGTTGVPKGVVVTHANVIRLLTATRPWFDFGPDDVWTLFHSAAFDFSVWEIWGALCHGGKLVVVDAEVVRAPREFLELLVAQRVTVLNQTPSAFGLLVDAEADRLISGDRLALRYVIFGGEPVEPWRLTDWWSRHDPRMPRLVNMYGITETTVFTTGTTLEGSAEAGEIGTPIPDLAVYVLDAALRPCPQNVPGELYVAGPGVAAGYLRGQGSTATRFVADPFGAPGTVMYRSGDLARRDDTGTLEYFGRVDRQVKIRGFRIEPGEIEAALSTLPAVRSAVVSTVEYRPGDRRLAAFVTGAGIDIAEVRAALVERLPAHAVPSTIVTVDAIPTTHNGKVDERRLRALALGGGAADGGALPRTDVEARLHSLFAEVLGHDVFGIGDGFFAVGGDSILAIRLADRARAEGLALTPRDIFEQQNIRALAATAALLPPVPALPPTTRGGRTLLPATPLQAGLLFHSLYQAGDGKDPYLVQAALTLDGRIDAQRLATALRTVLDRHPHLLGRFVVDGDRPEYEIRSDVELPWRVVDLADLAAADRDEAVRRVRAEDARMDPLVAPMLTVTLVRTESRSATLLVTHHHALLDGWSLGIALRELLLAYRGLELPAATPFTAFLDRSAARDGDRAREAWARALAGAEPSKVARGDRQRWRRPEERSYVLPAAMVSGLREQAAAHALTLNTMIQALWALVISNLTGSDDVVFGITVSGRDGGDLGGVVGLLMNTVPLRVRTCPSTTPLDIAVRIQRERVALMAHDHLGLADIMAAAGASDLFDTSLVFENFPLDRGLLDTSDADVQVTSVDVRGGTHFPLTVVVVPESGELTFRIGAQLDRIDSLADIDELWSRVHTAAVALTTSRQSPVGRLDLLPPARRAAVLAAGRGADTDLDHGGLARCFESIVRAHTHDIALWCDGVEFTYAEVNARANRVARWLRSRGVRPGAPIGIALPRSVDLVVAFLAVAKLGALCVPLSDRYPPAQVRQLLAFTGTDLVLRELDSAAAEFDDSDLGVAVSPDAVATLMFTSGSTGASKGVEVTHRNIVARARDRIGHGEGYQRMLMHLPYNWDMVVWELWLPLLTGRTTVLARPGVLDVHDYTEVLRAGRVTSIMLPAGLFDLLAEQIPDELAGLRMIASAGDVLPPRAAATVRRGAHPPVVTNLYGPVEATSYALGFAIAGDTSPDRPVPIGRPADNTRVAVLDAALRPVPAGITGEIYLSGAGLANGYHRAPARTAERFVADPFGPAGARMYRTGDLGRWDADGLLHFLGRADRQLKVNGFRVEPGEVEAALRRESGVTAAIVTARRVVSGQSLLAHIVADDAVDVAALRTRLAATLPSYLVPSAIVVLDELPLTPMGKIDVGALPVPATGARIPVRTPRQQVIGTAFAQALGIAEVGITDDFFALGGNSLSAIRVVATLRSTLGVTVSLRDLFESPTIAALERVLDQRAAGNIARGTGTSSNSLATVRRTEPIPLTPAQQRLWTVNYLSGNRPDYLIATGLEVYGPLDPAAVEAAVTDLVERHEILRTVLPYTVDGPIQRILPREAARPDFRVVDVSRGESIDRAMDSELLRGFDLATELPLRIRLYRPSAEHHILLGVLHHVAGDGESLGVLHRDLLTAYRARAAGRAPDWTAAPTQFADYTLWRRQLLDADGTSGATLERQSRYWRTALDGMSSHPVLPVDHPRTERRDNIAAAVPIHIDAATHRALALAARGHQASIYMLVHTALALALRDSGAGTDLPVGVAVSARDAEGLQDLVGCVVDTAIVRVDLSGDPSRPELVAQVRDRVLGAYENKEFPFDSLVELLNPPRSRTHHPLFQVMVTYLRGVDIGTVGPGLTIRHHPVPVRRTPWELLLNLREEYGHSGEYAGIHGEMIYAAELFDRTSVESMATAMMSALEILCIEPAREDTDHTSVA
ncbi:amino acid adenylation domain-containing protein [Nocardia uniformis]|uniref:Amino acid adenylation domain-containing protein n=1 Tax=Nocardia uniformis TaxID=53432 RepID=A0A849BZA8_9NOCA|nr:non-ribosomal peptide synthetase [Nocardia uniformis]NNH69580.1 amino acid adenylation domain-containing protein [Nocardia uniformis]